MKLQTENTTKLFIDKVIPTCSAESAGKYCCDNDQQRISKTYWQVDSSQTIKHSDKIVSYATLQYEASL